MLPTAFSLIPPLAAAAAPVLFLDFDGTLAPLVARPDAAVLPEATRGAVARAAAIMPLAVVSGRHLDDLSTRVGIAGIAYAGSHGLEIATADGRRSRHGDPGAFEEDLRAAAHTFDAYAAARRGLGLLVEHKPFSLAVHYPHGEPASEAHLRHQIRTLAARFDRLEMIAGKHVLELRPRSGWDKGSAVDLLLARQTAASAPGGTATSPPRALLPVFVGDDLTDEDGFRVVAARGYAVRVGGTPEWRTAASHVLDSPEVVREWLDALVAARRASAGRAWRNAAILDNPDHPSPDRG